MGEERRPALDGGDGVVDRVGQGRDLEGGLDVHLIKRDTPGHRRSKRRASATYPRSENIDPDREQRMNEVIQRLRSANPALMVAVTALMVLAVAFSIPRFAMRQSPWMIDFKAFYCAATTATQRDDPYLQQPLYDCESKSTGPFLVHTRNHIVVPAPLPGYAIAAFVPLSLLPYRMAAGVWALVLIGAFVLSVHVLSLLTGIERWVVFSASFLPLIVFPLAAGNPAPISICAISLCALWLRHERYALAAAAATVAMIEPHLALPIVISLALWAPRSRPVLMIGILALAALSFAFLGLSENVEYMTRVLPAQTAAELRHIFQFSLSAVLYAFGLSATAAAHYGELSYLVMALLGILVAGRLYANGRDPAYLVFAPAAFVVLGGPYMHADQIAAAIPLALVLSTKTEQGRLLAVLALLLLAVPWEFVAFTGDPIIVATLAVLVLACCFLGMRLGLVLTVIATLALVLLNVWLPHTGTLAHATGQPRALAEASWTIEVAATYSHGSAAAWWSRALTWVGLILLLWSAISRALPSRRSGTHGVQPEATSG
ncbi:DUF2029 domain-containing protein [bacterium]|nr:MAG: DUF2029 domain-containing protein [bacterium]